MDDVLDDYVDTHYPPRETPLMSTMNNFKKHEENHSKPNVVRENHKIITNDIQHQKAHRKPKPKMSIMQSMGYIPQPKQVKHPSPVAEAPP